MRGCRREMRLKVEKIKYKTDIKIKFVFSSPSCYKRCSFALLILSYHKFTGCESRKNCSKQQLEWTFLLPACLLVIPSNSRC